MKFDLMGMEGIAADASWIQSQSLPRPMKYLNNIKCVKGTKANNRLY